ELHLALVYAYETLSNEEMAFRQSARGLMEHPRHPQLLAKMNFHADGSTGRQKQSLLVFEQLADADPDNEDILQNLTRTALRLDQTDLAIQALNRRKALHPLDRKLRNALIHIYEDSQRFDELIAEREDFARLLEKTPIEPTKTNLINEYRRLVSLYRARQRIGGEIHVLQRLITLVPEVKYQRFEYLNALARGRQFKEFETALAQALIDHSDDRTLHELRVSHALRQRKFVEAEQHAATFLRKYPTDRSFWSYLFVAIQAQPQTEANTQRLIARTLEASKNLGYPINTANAIAFAKDANQIELVRLTVEKWIDQHPTDLDSWTLLLHQYAAAAQLTDRARFELYTEALQRFPDEKWIRVDAAYTGQLVKQWDFSAGIWRDLLKTDDEADYYRNLMICLVHTGQAEELDRTLAIATEKYPDDLAMREEVAFQKQLTKEWPYAARVWEQLVKLSPPNADYYENLIYCYDQAGQTDKADATLERVTRRFNHPGLRTQYASRLQEKKNWAAAADMWHLLIHQPSTTNHQPSREHHESFLACLYELTDQKKNWNGAPAIEGYYTAVTQAHKLFPSHEPFQINAAYVAHDLKKWGAAADLWAGLVKRHPDSIDYRKNRLVSLAQSGAHKQYETELIASLQDFPNDTTLATDAVYALIAQVTGRGPDASRRDESSTSTTASSIQHRASTLSLSAISTTTVLDSIITALEEQPPTLPVRLALFDAHQALRHTEDADALLTDLYARHPEEPNVLLRANAAFINKRDWDNAIATGYALIQHDPKNEDYRERYRTALSSAKRWDKLIPVLEEDISRNPKDEDAIALLAYHYADKEQYDLAMPHFERLVRLDPENTDYTVSLVYSYLDQQQLEPAQKILEAQWETLPGNIEVGALLADLYQKNGNEEEAKKIQRRLIESAGDNPAVLTSVGDRLLRLNAMEEAEEVYARALRIDENNTRALKGLGRIKSWNNAPKPALNYFERYVELVPEDIDARIALAKLYAGLRTKATAKREFEEALRMLDALEGGLDAPRQDEAARESTTPPLHHSPSTTAANTNTGPSSIEHPASSIPDTPAAETTSALTSIEHRVSSIQHPISENPTAARATALAGLGRIDEAIPHFAKLIEENPTDGYVYGDYAEALLDNKRHREAEDILAISPKKGIYHLRNMRLKARSLFERRRYHDAAEVLEEVLIKAPRDMGVIKELAYFSEVLERWPAALRLYKTAWQDAKDLGGEADTLDEAIRLMRDHNPQVRTSYQTTSSGADDLNHGRLFLSYPLSSLSDTDLQTGDLYVHPLLDTVELQAEFLQRQLKGPALFAGAPDVSASTMDFNVNGVVRPGHGLKFTLGLSGSDNPGKFIMGAKAAAAYRQEDWTTEITFKWREHWFDPVRFSPFAGARDEVRWDLNYFPREWLSTYSSLATGKNHLLAAPTGGPSNVFQYTSWDAGADLRVLRAPHSNEENDTQLWLTYNFSFQDGSQEDFYANLIALQQERFTHTVGLRLDHDIGKRFNLRASTGLGMDSKRSLGFGDLLTYQVGFTWHITDLLELRGDFLKGSETTLSDDSTYTQSNLELLWRF
ncbi:MAG: tetratricopeptide repeat protein, partial [Planctomycetota bacterium]|nr:tetratricopeptide repeat protein [Planctomycetota bacterium]